MVMWLTVGRVPLQGSGGRRRAAFKQDYGSFREHAVTTGSCSSPTVFPTAIGAMGDQYSEPVLTEENKVAARTRTT